MVCLVMFCRYFYGWIIALASTVLRSFETERQTMKTRKIKRERKRLKKEGQKETAKERKINKKEKR